MHLLLLPWTKIFHGMWGRRCIPLVQVWISQLSGPSLASREGSHSPQNRLRGSLKTTHTGEPPQNDPPSPNLSNSYKRPLHFFSSPKLFWFHRSCTPAHAPLVFEHPLGCARASRWYVRIHLFDDPRPPHLVKSSRFSSILLKSLLTPTRNFPSVQVLVHTP